MPSVWIDTDMGFDDLAAVLAVQHAPGWSIAGMSLVAGNASLPIVCDNTRRAAACFGWGFAIHAGCAGPLEGELVTAQHALGPDGMASAGRKLPLARIQLEKTDAVSALARWIEQEKEPATVLALGPLTNIALALQQQPQLAGRIGQLMWMGGSAAGGNHTAAAEFNAFVDPEALNVVLEAGVRLRMVGLDACRQACVGVDDARSLREVDGGKAQMLADLLLGYVRIAGDSDSVRMALYDPTAAAALIAPGSVQFRPAHVVGECKGEHTRGMTVVEWRVPRRELANCEVATVVDEAAVRATVLRGLEAAARG